MLHMFLIHDDKMDEEAITKYSKYMYFIRTANGQVDTSSFNAVFEIFQEWVYFLPE